MSRRTTLFLNKCKRIWRTVTKKKYITKSERVKFNKNPLKYKDTFYDPIGQLGHTTIGMHSIKLTEAIPANEPPSRDLRYKRQTISDNMKLK